MPVSVPTLKTWTPNLLTIGRVCCVPVVVAGVMSGNAGHWTAFAAFVLASVTDALDGYCARAWNRVSALGCFLDPVADKLLVGSTLLVLAASGTIAGPHLWAALVILCREFLVSGLREYLADIHVQMPVTQLARWKTTIQLTALSVLLLPASTPWFPVWHNLGLFGLWTGSALSVMTGTHYIRSMARHLRTRN